MEKELPFFARFLEGQQAGEDLVPVKTDVKAGGGGLPVPVTQKYPSDKDEFKFTLKYPSDQDEI